MKFEKRIDLTDEVLRVYNTECGAYEIHQPVAVYSTPGLDYEGVLDARGELHLVPRPGTCGVRVVSAPTASEPLDV